MGSSVAGITLPEGDPGAAADAASGLRSAAGGFERTGAVTQQAVASTPSWQGMASFSFRDSCAGYQDAAAAAEAACALAAGVLRRYAERLEEGRERVRRLQERAQECLERIRLAESRAADAADRAAFASHMAYQAGLGSAADAGATAASFRAQADDAWGEHAAAEADAQAWRDELERLRQAAEDERELVREAGRVAAGMVASAEGGLPMVSAAAPAATAAAGAPAPVDTEEEEDKPFWEDAVGALGDAASWTGGQIVGFGEGVGEGVVGIGEGGLMLYRLSLANAIIDPESHQREWENVESAVEFAREDPGEFAKAVANWEDLSEGRYGEWLGNLGPDAVLAAATAGAGTAATRGLRGADAMADVADAARDANRAADAARDTGRAADAARGIPGGGLTEAGQRALMEGDEVVRHWTPLDADRPLAEAGRGDTFRSSTYDEVRLSEDRLFYRDYSDPNKRLSAFWTRQPSSGPFQSMLDSAILPEWGNRATHTLTIRVPAGTTVYEGPTAPQRAMVGGGDQTVIPEVNPAWVVEP